MRFHVRKSSGVLEHPFVESASFDEWGEVLLGAWDYSVPRPEAWPTSHVSARRGTVSVIVVDGMGSMYTLLTVSFDGSNKRIIPLKLPAYESLTGLTTQIVPSSNGPHLLRHIDPGNLGPPLAPAHRHTIIQLGLPASGMSDVDEDLPPVFGPVAMRVPVKGDAECHIAAASPSGRYALVVEGKQLLLSRFAYGGTREDRPLELEGKISKARQNVGFRGSTDDRGPEIIEIPLPKLQMLLIFGLVQGHKLFVKTLIVAMSSITVAIVIGVEMGQLTATLGKEALTDTLSLCVSDLRKPGICPVIWRVLIRGGAGVHI
ncbi:hypothetical protein B0H13DRAFT_1859296 [Mycena leptocephala]|nr:hypothetical protein B0H13DRAFT_1859296 [Mycena leptocephala]